MRGKGGKKPPPLTTEATQALALARFQRRAALLRENLAKRKTRTQAKRDSSGPGGKEDT